MTVSPPPSSRTAALSLYRSILRAHQKHLATQRPEMKELGDAYVKSEFRLHKTATPEQAASFMREWNTYLEQLSMTARARESVSAGSLDSTTATANRTSSRSENSAADGNVFGFGSENLDHKYGKEKNQVFSSLAGRPGS